MSTHTRIVVVTVIMISAASIMAQSNANDFSVTTGPNYSSVDRKHTATAQWLIPNNFSYRLNCLLMFAVDDDSLVSNKAQIGWDAGTGDLGFEAHVTLWHAGQNSGPTCAAGSNNSLRLDYIATVPVPGTLESTELGNQFKVTFNRPTARGDSFFVNAGVNILGAATGGNTVGAIASANYYRAFKPQGVWGAEGEVDLGSATKVSPSSVSVLFAVDGALNASQSWNIRFGAAIGITPYAPMISPFIQFTYLGHVGSKNNKNAPSVLY